MSISRKSIRASVAIVASLTLALALASCSPGGVQLPNEVPLIASGGVQLPQEFPQEVPLTAGEVVYTHSDLTDDTAKVWVVRVNVQGLSVIKDIEAQLRDAGFETMIEGDYARAEIAMERGDLGVFVKIYESDEHDLYVAQYSVFESP